MRIAGRSGELRGLRRPPAWLLIAALVSAGLVAVANYPATTETFVDFDARPVTQPLYAKVIAFLDRDIQMRQLEERIVGDARTPEDKAERILRWTAANIRPTPPGMPIIDDHPYSIVLRGYGQTDQAADVFANLAAYAGVPGGLTFSRRPDGSVLYSFAVLQIGGADRLFDVREGRALRRPDGALASIAELRADPGLLDGLGPPAAAHGVPYPVLIERLDSGPIRRPSNQMPLSRLLNEIGRLFRR